MGGLANNNPFFDYQRKHEEFQEEMKMISTRRRFSFGGTQRNSVSDGGRVSAQQILDDLEKEVQMMSQDVDLDELRMSIGTQNKDFNNENPNLRQQQHGTSHNDEDRFSRRQLQQKLQHSGYSQQRQHHQQDFSLDLSNLEHLDASMASFGFDNSSKIVEDNRHDPNFGKDFLLSEENQHQKGGWLFEGSFGVDGGVGADIDLDIDGEIGASEFFDGQRADTKGVVEMKRHGEFSRNNKGNENFDMAGLLDVINEAGNQEAVMNLNGATYTTTSAGVGKGEMERVEDEKEENANKSNIEGSDASGNWLNPPDWLQRGKLATLSVEAQNERNTSNDNARPPSVSSSIISAHRSGSVTAKPPTGLPLSNHITSPNPHQQQPQHSQQQQASLQLDHSLRSNKSGFSVSEINMTFDTIPTNGGVDENLEMQDLVNVEESEQVRDANALESGSHGTIERLSMNQKASQGIQRESENEATPAIDAVLDNGVQPLTNNENVQTDAENQKGHKYEYEEAQEKSYFEEDEDHNTMRSSIVISIHTDEIPIQVHNHQHQHPNQSPQRLQQPQQQQQQVTLNAHNLSQSSSPSSRSSRLHQQQQQQQRRHLIAPANLDGAADVLQNLSVSSKAGGFEYGFEKSIGDVVGVEVINGGGSDGIGGGNTSVIISVQTSALAPMSPRGGSGTRTITNISISPSKRSAGRVGNVGAGMRKDVFLNGGRSGGSVGSGSGSANGVFASGLVKSHSTPAMLFAAAKEEHQEAVSEEFENKGRKIENVTEAKREDVADSASTSTSAALKTPAPKPMPRRRTASFSFSSATKPTPMMDSGNQETPGGPIDASTPSSLAQFPNTTEMIDTPFSVASTIGTLGTTMNIDGGVNANGGGGGEGVSTGRLLVDESFPGGFTPSGMGVNLTLTSTSPPQPGSVSQVTRNIELDAVSPLSRFHVGGGGVGMRNSNNGNAFWRQLLNQTRTSNLSRSSSPRNVFPGSEGVSLASVKSQTLGWMGGGMSGCFIEPSEQLKSMLESARTEQMEILKRMGRVEGLVQVMEEIASSVDADVGMAVKVEGKDR
jgi:hypothetical protein